MAPFLILILGARPIVAVGTDLAYAALTKAVGGAQHARQGTVDGHVVRWLAAGSLPGALVGVGITAALEAGQREAADAIVARALGFTLVAVALTLLLQPIIGDRWRSRARFETRPPALVALGLVTGVVVGLTSLGSGALLGAALVLFTGLPYRRVVGTDVLHGAVISAAAGVAHAALGHVDVRLTIALLVGSLPGVMVGTRLAGRVPDRALRTALGLMLLFAGTRLV